MATLTRRRFQRRSHSAIAFNGIGTGNITDRTRGTLNAAIGDDGLTNDLSTGIWLAATNLRLNGGFTTNTTGWAAYP